MGTTVKSAACASNQAGHTSCNPSQDEVSNTNMPDQPCHMGLEGERPGLREDAMSQAPAKQGLYYYYIIIYIVASLGYNFTRCKIHH